MYLVFKLIGHVVFHLPCRDVREFKTRVDSYSREILRKESLIKDLQTRLENGEGSESALLSSLGVDLSSGIRTTSPSQTRSAA